MSTIPTVIYEEIPNAINPFIYEEIPNAINPFASEDMDFFINYDYVNNTINFHCELLEGCIRDVQRNARKYHISFMMEKINNGDLNGIKHLKGVNMLLAHRLVMERRRGRFKNVSSLSRVGMSRGMIDTLIRNNC
jgi:hypothetical protein